MIEFYTPSLSLLLFSVVIVFFLNIPYRFLMNRHDVASVKAKVKELQERSKYVQRQGNAMLASQLMRESLVESSKLTKLTMKPMLASLVIVVLVLPLIGNSYNDVTVAIKDGTGEAKLNGNMYAVEVNGNNVKISNDIECAMPCRKSFDNALWNVVLKDNNVVVQRIVALLPVSLPIFGDAVGWLGWYFMVSIPLMILFRKLLKINI